jgi:hypothetical protein
MGLLLAATGPPGEVGKVCVCGVCVCLCLCVYVCVCECVCTSGVRLYVCVQELRMSVQMCVNIGKVAMLGFITCASTLH